VTAFSKKICLLGDFAVGKTSLVRRFVYNLFDDRYISTIGVKVSRKTVAIPRGEDVVDLTMMLWDLASSEEFTPMRASYLRGAAGAVLVCDLTRPETLDTLRTYANDLLGVNHNAQLILAANKRDLLTPEYLDSSPSADTSHSSDTLHSVGAGNYVTPAQIESLAVELNAPFYLTSAKTGKEVEALFRHLGRLVLS